MRPENEPQKIEEIEIQSLERPENVIEEINSIEILPLEKEPLRYQLIDELLIEAIERPENEVQMIEEFNIDAKGNISILFISSMTFSGLSRLDNSISSIFWSSFSGLNKAAMINSSIC